MAYQKIVLPSTVDPRVRRFIASQVDMYLADVHEMLRLPLPDIGMTHGCNFAIVEVLNAVISGLSRVFRPGEGTSKAFRRVLHHWPYDEEPDGVVSRRVFKDQMYETYRCNLVHSLGINVPNPVKGQKRRKIIPLPLRTVIVRMKNDDIGLTETQIEELETSAVRPDWLPRPTLQAIDGCQKLLVESMYRGTRILVARLCDRPGLCASARSFLKPIDTPMIIAPPTAALLSGTSPTVTASTNLQTSVGSMAAGFGGTFDAAVTKTSGTNNEGGGA